MLTGVELEEEQDIKIIVLKQVFIMNQMIVSLNLELNIGIKHIAIKEEIMQRQEQKKLMLLINYF